MPIFNNKDEDLPCSFRSSHKNRSVFLAQIACCCCCCWHIVGAYLGAYFGSVVGSGVAYRRVQRDNEKEVKYRWLFLWSFLSTCTILGVIYIIVLLGINISNWLLVLLAVWFVLINPCVCFIAAKKFSWRILLLSLLFSVPMAAIGFGIGWAVLYF
jgi:hypothetical protein